MKRIKKAILLILIAWVLIFSIDFSLVKLSRAPIFSMPLIRYKDGGSIEHFGLGYKVIRYKSLADIEAGKPIRYEIGTWFMPFE